MRAGRRLMAKEWPGGIRRAAVAGRWYPGTAASLASAVEAHLAGAGTCVSGRLVALIAPHAALLYSGPVAAYAYRLLRGRAIDLIVLAGPSHFDDFDGVAVYPAGAFETPLGPIDIDAGCASALLEASPMMRAHPAAHAREHSLEMQLPFIRRLAPQARIVPLLMGRQTAEAGRALGDALAAVLEARARVLLVASTDLSHYHDAATAASLDAVVIGCVERFDADGLQEALDRRPDHACGGGPTIAVMRAARRLGARDAVVLRYADSGDVSGDKSAVVGYLAAALGVFTKDPGNAAGAQNPEKTEDAQEAEAHVVPARTVATR
ncbi:MAG: AmmeMemoRadiSam system protein B [Acidobacteria bacterium]|nr:AmmeMemoRadiSam system protein B [Acidobacteriota bacterium]